ncbi:MAG: hypothetical protein ACPGYV_00510 [Phycisphaeraceae bacterium]
MDEPLTRWYCDTCGEPIEGGGDGILVWHRENNLVTGHQIVHRDRCDVPSEGACENLSNFLGSDGLVYMTAFFTRGRILTLHGEQEENEVQDPPAYAELIRRLHVPHYEEARRYFGESSLYERHAGAAEVAPYRQESLISIIEEHGASQ